MEKIMSQQPVTCPHCSAFMPFPLHGGSIVTCTQCKKRSEIRVQAIALSTMYCRCGTFLEYCSSNPLINCPKCPTTIETKGDNGQPRYIDNVAALAPVVPHVVPQHQSPVVPVVPVIEKKNNVIHQNPAQQHHYQQQPVQYQQQPVQYQQQPVQHKPVVVTTSKPRYTYNPNNKSQQQNSQYQYTPQQPQQHVQQPQNMLYNPQQVTQKPPSLYNPQQPKPQQPKPQQQEQYSSPAPVVMESQGSGPISQESSNNNNNSSRSSGIFDLFRSNNNNNQAHGDYVALPKD